MRHRHCHRRTRRRASDETRGRSGEGGEGRGGGINRLGFHVPVPRVWSTGERKRRGGVRRSEEETMRPRKRNKLHRRIYLS